MPTKGSSDMVQAMSFMEEFIHAGLNELHLSTGFQLQPSSLSLQRGGGKNLQVPVQLLPQHMCVTVGAQVVPKVAPVSWTLSHVLSFMLARTWKLVSQLPPAIHQIQTAVFFGCESEMVWRETHVFFDQRYYFCCLTFPYWYMDYGKKPDLESDFSMFIL